MKEYNKANIPLAKTLRKNMTPWERKLWYEFLRYYPEAEKTYFLGVNFWQAVALICIATGTAWLLLITTKRKRNSKA